MEHNGLLQEAALNGDITTLTSLLSQDNLLLHRPSKILPLHIASKHKKNHFVVELLRLNPNLTEDLDPIENSSPLHVASGNGHVDIVKALVSANPSMCLARDVHGRNPAHVAAMKGHVLVLEELIRAVPAVARERVGGRGDTIMHVCVKFNQLDALELVASKARGVGFLLNATDEDGNTILHLAVADQRLEIIDFLIRDDRVKKNIQNKHGMTEKDIFIEHKKDVGNNNIQRLSMSLLKVKLLTSKQINKEKEKEIRSAWIHNHRSTLMVVASLVATMAFQAGLTPPPMNENDNEYAIYHQFVIFNTIGLMSSLTSIILLISGLPAGRRFFMIVVVVMMWVAITAMAWTYGISLYSFTLKFLRDMEKGKEYEQKDTSVRLVFLYTFGMSFSVWTCVMALILLGHVTTWTVRIFKKVRWLVKKIRQCF